MERDRQVPFLWVTCDLWITRCRRNTFLDVTLLPGVKTFYKDMFAFPLLAVRLYETDSRELEFSQEEKERLKPDCIRRRNLSPRKRVHRV